MNREDALDSMAYWYKSMYHAESNAETKEYPKWRTQCLNKPYWHNPNPKVLGKVIAVDYTSDKDHLKVARLDEIIQVIAAIVQSAAAAAPKFEGSVVNPGEGMPVISW